MANGWIQGQDEQWQATLLAGEAWQLDGRESGAAWLPTDSHHCDADVLLLRIESGRAERWLLMARRDRGVTVNGVPLELGLCELRDRDEVAVVAGANDSPETAPRRLFYSSERLAELEPLPEGPRPVYCVRCKQLIAVGTPAVRCPSPACGLWHHQSSELPCWEYAENCAVCDQLTDRNLGFRWTPEDL